MDSRIPNLNTPSFEFFRALNNELQNENATFYEEFEIESISDESDGDHGKVSEASNSVSHAKMNECILTQKRQLEHCDYVIDNLKNGSFTYVSPLSKEDITVPPVGIQRYSPQERERRLQQIASLEIDKKSGTLIESGCSLVLNILADELRESYLALLKTRICQREKNCRKIIENIYVNIESYIGLLSRGALNFGKYNGRINPDNIINPIREIQSSFIVSCNNILDDEGRWHLQEGDREYNRVSEICNNALVNSIEGKRFTDALILLREIVSQEMHRLYSPLNNTFSLSNHYPRILRRVVCFKNRLIQEGEYENCKKSIVHDYSNLIKNNRSALIQLCDAIIFEIEPLQRGKNNVGLGKLWIALEAYVSNKKIESDRNALIQQIDLELSDLEKQKDNDLIYFNRIACRSGWFYTSSLDDIYLTLLLDLIVASKVSNLEIDCCIENLLNVAKSILSHESNNIIEQLKLLPGNNKYSGGLQDFWETEVEIFQKKILTTMINHIEIRLERCRKNPNDQIERALTLRDALNLFSVQFSNKNALEKQNLQEFRSKLVKSSLCTPLHLKVLQDILDVTNLHSEAVEASIQGIKALIGRCFIQAQKEAQDSDESARKDLALKELQAQNAVEELLKSKTAAKRKKKKKKSSTVPSAEATTQPLPIETAPVVKDSKAQLNQNPIPLKVNTEIAAKKVVNAPPQTPVEKQEPILLTPKANKSKAKNLPDISSSLSKCEIHLQHLERIQFFKEPCWQSGQLENLDLLLENLRETSEIEGFSVDRIFEQRDLLRRSTEALLEVITVFSHTDREEVQALGHNAEKLVYMLMGNPIVPENVKKLIWSMRNIPFSLADANRCVNYLAEANSQRKKLKDTDRQLVDFLMKVHQEGLSSNKNEALRIELASQQKNYLQRSVYFIEQLLEILCHPDQIVEGELPLVFLQKQPQTNSQNVNINLLENITNNLPALENIIPLENNNITSINNRADAHAAIDTALVWTGIRCLAPVEGFNLVNWRTQERNIALNNVAIYLRLLKGKMGIDRHNRPMSTTLGECSLIRRALKELTIAALYHTDSLENGQHIIQSRDIRFSNSPNFLMSVLHSVSTRAKDLPMLGSWTHRAHQVLSYPTLQENKVEDFSSTQLQGLVFEVYKASKAMKVHSQETLVLAGGIKQTPEKRLQERVRLVEANEKERIFPALASLLYLLKFGLSIPRLAQLNAAYVVLQ